MNDLENRGTKPKTRLQFLYACFLACCMAMLAVHSYLASRTTTSIFKRSRHAQPRNVSSTIDLLGDIVHLNNLNEACFHARDVVLPWTFNSSDVDMNYVWTQDMPRDRLVQLLAQCPEVDVYLPPGLRNHGYCEDGMAYVKFLKSRALPSWVFDLTFDYQGRKNISYHDLCPKTALLFMNHYMDGIHTRPSFPKDKKLVLMPNVEMYELKTKDYQRFDMILCKTRDAYDRLTQLLHDMGNPRNTTVLYVQHTSSDPTTVARTHAAAHPELPRIRPKDFENITFFHANGHSAQKNTKSIFECWKARPDLPPIDVYSMYSGTKEDFDEVFAESDSPESLRFHYGEDVDVSAFGRLLLEASTILCPSKMEGFGHYINQARASGALVLTTNGTPMNEFVDKYSGVLIEAYAEDPDPNQQLSIYGGMTWRVTEDAICDAVDAVVAMTPEMRRTLARNGRRRYEEQFVDFKGNMRLVRSLLDS
ncbi:hypothetical protein ACHHYP_08447 [Achlya hypogyna]|uniref:Glycosyl transferase family 1 domain-containing protein n=1 Tax=Achlya hypogyna TaxID=1202772 RepID=A0A1V9ZKK5_ACHHY|nr:hypothetical protein ACHHYP_08447 [Achlya hypogyna]